MPWWKIHPMSVHFPIAFLLAAVALDLVATRWQLEGVTRASTGLLIAGVAFGWLAAGAGLLAYFTVPAHTEQAHTLMYWHLSLAIAMLSLFTWLGAVRLRGRKSAPTRWDLAISVFAAVLLLATGGLGGWIVYRGGAGVDPSILATEIREGHSHDEGGHEHGGGKSTPDAPNGHSPNVHYHHGQ